MRSSKAAFELIVAHEVTDRPTYERKYQLPEWPGVSSGITVGIGYDLGYNTKADIARDWAGKLPAAMIASMQSFAGYTGAAAKRYLPQARQHISVPWDAAMDVFRDVSLPKFEAMALRACPGSEDLPAGCFGVLTSLTYNRGASFTKKHDPATDPKDRYREMRKIRELIIDGDLEAVPAQIRSMKRLWDRNKVPGLHRRRDEEAALWEASLRAAPRATEPSNRVDTGDDRSEVTPSGNGINVQPERGKRSLEVEIIQRQLIEFKYFEVGEPDGLVGGKFVAGVSAFMNDRGKDPNRGRITQELKEELAAAKSERLPNGEPWTRPIAPARANATAKDIAPKIESVNQTWYQKIYAWVLGLPAAAVAGFKGLFGDDTAGGYIQYVKDFFSAIPAEFYLLGVVGLAIAIFLSARSAEKSTVKAYNEGKIN